MKRLARLVLGVGLLLITAHSALGAQSFASADTLVESGIRQGVYPAAALVIGTHDRIIHARGFGHLTWNRRSAVVTPDSTVWDLASLTKVLATTPALMILVDRNKVDLDAPVARYLPDFVGPGKDRVTVRMLLDHTSGEPAWRSFSTLAPDRDSAIRLLYDTPLERPAGESPKYSDLNFLLAGLLVERVTGGRLDHFVDREIFTPLAMHATQFLPPREWQSRIAPTGRFRGHPVAGMVNDQNAARFGGVAGHAGLFASATDVARYAQFWLRGGTLSSGVRLVSAATMAEFLSPKPGSGYRLLGWERPDPAEYDPDPYGSLLSDSAYGHTGWTGTQIWIDPVRDLFVVFLTNRSYDPRVQKPFSVLHRIRGEVADAVVRSWGSSAATRPVD